LGVIENKSVFNFGDNCFYYNNNEWCWDGKYGKKDGSGYKEGETVRVTVDFMKGVIEWAVGKQVRHKLECPQLKEKNIKWVPYICLWNQGDSAEITK
jgi:hypothetical protein